MHLTAAPLRFAARPVSPASRSAHLARREAQQAHAAEAACEWRRPFGDPRGGGAARLCLPVRATCQEGKVAMSTITEETAWSILHEYARDCLEIDSTTLIALYAIGSLPGGYYRPGQSDIDAVLIVANGSGHIWGNSEEASKSLKELNRCYLERFKIPKDFGPFPLQEIELFPPYSPAADVLTLEIARLKLQGEPVYGEFDLDAVPMPTGKDFLVGAQRFEEWWRDHFSPVTPPAAMGPTGCVNTILIHLGRFLRVKRGIIEFNKLRLVSTYLDNGPPFVNRAVLDLVEKELSSQVLAEDEIELLRSYVSELRPAMNAYLGVVV